MWLILLLGCKDAKLVPFAEALDAYEEGRNHLTGGDPTRAAEAFARARAQDGDSPSLAVWEAKARADQGHPAEAEAVLDEVLTRHPELALARYNRAAYRARQGRLGEAAADLREALARQVASPYAAAADPDFAPFRTDPHFADMLPALPMVGAMIGPEGSVWIGSALEIRIRLESLVTTTLSLRREGWDPGCLRLDRVLEDDAEQADVRLRELTLRFTTLAPCKASVGPFVATAGNIRLDIGSAAIVVEAPPGVVGETAALPVDLPIPSQYPPDGATVRTEILGGSTLAMGPLDAGLTAGGQKPDYLVEWRLGGQTRARGGVWAGQVEVRARSPRP